VNCVLLKRAEQRFAIGDSDGIYTEAEYRGAFTADYNLYNAPYNFYNTGTHARLGLEIRF
jgi:hypothetical protein